MTCRGEEGEGEGQGARGRLGEAAAASRSAGGACRARHPCARLLHWSRHSPCQPPAVRWNTTTHTRLPSQPPSGPPTLAMPSAIFSEMSRSLSRVSLLFLKPCASRASRRRSRSRSRRRSSRISSRLRRLPAPPETPPPARRPDPAPRRGRGRRGRGRAAPAAQPPHPTTHPWRPRRGRAPRRGRELQLPPARRQALPSGLQRRVGGEGRRGCDACPQRPPDGQSIWACWRRRQPASQPSRAARYAPHPLAAGRPPSHRAPAPAAAGTAPPILSMRALSASSRSSRSLRSFSLASSSRCILERASTALRAFCSAMYSDSVNLANWSLMATSCRPRPSAARRLSSGMV